MKQIDFSKPLCRVGKTSGRKDGPVEVIKEGLTLVRFTGELHVIDENGRIEGYAVQPGDDTLWVENVPEEPKDHIILFKSRLPPHGWRVNRWSDGTAVPYTRTEAEHQARGEAGRYIAVKVPV